MTVPTCRRHRFAHLPAVFVGAAAMAASLTGCSHDHGFPTAVKPTVTYSGGAMALTNDAKVTVDGQEHKVDGRIACTAFDDGDTIIAVGVEPNAVKVTLTGNSDSPTVKMVLIQNIGDYTTLYVMDPPPKGDATVSKDGKNYTVTGTSSGIDKSGRVVEGKAFRITLTCP